MKDENRIEIIGAYYLRIVIGKLKFDNENFYERKSSAMRAAQSLSGRLVLPIYDYNGHDPYWGIPCPKKEFKIIEACNAQFKRSESGSLKLLEGVCYNGR